MQAANLFVHNISSFRGYRKIILGVIRKWSSEVHWILNVIWVIDISGWLSTLQFLSVTLPVMEIKSRLFHQVVKKLGRPRPLRVRILRVCLWVALWIPLYEFVTFLLGQS